MEKLTRTQLQVLASYSSPFVLLSALVLNISLLNLHISEGPLRLMILSSAVPIGFTFGRLIYLRRSHIEILFDNNAFKVIKGTKEVSKGNWRSYRLVSIALDQYGRPNLRLYSSPRGDFVELPTSRTNADPQKFRDHVRKLVSRGRVERLSPQVAEAS